MEVSLTASPQEVEVNHNVVLSCKYWVSNSYHLKVAHYYYTGQHAVYMWHYSDGGRNSAEGSYVGRVTEARCQAWLRYEHCITLWNVTLRDEGQYKCYVERDNSRGHSNATSITVLGLYILNMTAT